MHIVRIEVENWMCFRGQHKLELKKGIYAITARHRTNGERSNWLGKTSLLNAIRFAITGDRPEQCRYEDDWITKGEDAGLVRTVFDSGLVVTRSRRRGKSTSLEARTEQGSSRQTEAQKVIDQHLGLAQQSTWFFGQKTMDWFIRARPAHRVEEIANWTGIALLGKCEEIARSMLRTAIEGRTKIEHELYRSEASFGQLFQAEFPSIELPKTIAECEDHFVKRQCELDRELAKARELSAELTEQYKECLRIDADNRKALDRERVRVDVEAQKILVQNAEKKAPNPVQFARTKQAYDRAKVALGVCEESLKQRQALAAGRFSGMCPIAAMQCPIANEINARVDENKALLEADRKRLAEHRASLGEREKAFRELSERRDDVSRQVSKYESMKSLFDRMPVVSSDSIARSDSARVFAEMNAANTRKAKYEVGVAAFERNMNVMREHWHKAVALKAKLEKESDAIRTMTEAVEIFGRTGAQRRIAEQATEQIEQRANELLSRSGIDLSIAIRWEVEGAGAADHCASCGAAYLPSMRIKECASCGAARGKKVEDRLDVVLSDRSGAAEDLAGIAVMLAASEMIRTSKESCFGVACLDEPFGALDKANRKAFAHGLVTMLRDGWEQVFVVAHDDALMDAMPGRIVIEASDEGSCVRVG